MLHDALLQFVSDAKLPSIVVAIAVVLSGLGGAVAQECRPGDIEVERTEHGVRCRPPTAAECLRNVGLAFPEKRKQLCSLAVGRCFNQKKAQIAAAALACLVTCLDAKQLALGQIDIPKCGRNCGLAELLIAYKISEDCLFDGVNQCQSEALAQQRADLNNCRK